MNLQSRESMFVPEPPGPDNPQGYSTLTALSEMGWDARCSAIAASVPVLVLSNFLPAAARSAIGPILVGLGFVGAALSPPVGLYAMLVAIFLGPSFAWTAESTGANYGKLCAVAVAMGVLLYRNRQGQRLARVPKSFWFFILLSIAIVLSALFNGRVASVYEYQNFAIGALLFLLVSNAVSSVQELYIAAVGLLALMQTTVAFAVLFGETSYRIAATGMVELGDQNNLALFLASTLPFAVYLCFRTGRRRPETVFGFLSLGLGAALLAWSASRGTFVALLLGSIIFLLSRVLKPRQLVAASLVIAASVLAVPAPAREYALRHIMTQTVGSRLALAERQFLAEEGVRILLKSPWFGHGLGRSPIEIMLRNPRLYAAGKNVHNVYLQVGIDLGAFGLVPFLALIFANVIAGVRLARRYAASARNLSFLIMSVAVATVVFAVGSFFLGNLYSRIWYTILGLGSASLGLGGLRLLAQERQCQETRLDQGTRGW